MVVDLTWELTKGDQRLWEQGEEDQGSETHILLLLTAKGVVGGGSPGQVTGPLRALVSSPVREASGLDGPVKPQR